MTLASSFYRTFLGKRLHSLSGPMMALENNALPETPTGHYGYEVCEDLLADANVRSAQALAFFADFELDFGAFLQ